MTKKQKKLLSIGLLIMVLLLVTGCSVPRVTDPETGKEVVKLITNQTQFSDILGSEDWFQTFFVFPLAKVLEITAPYIGVAGAIALITAGVHFLVTLLTFKSTIASQKMQLLQPEMVKIQKKYEGKDDQESKMRMAQETQALYKKHGINPFATILTTFLQLPIIFAIFYAVQRSEAIQKGEFLGLSLSNTPIDGLMNGQFLYILLFVIMGIFQLIAMKTPTWLANHKAKKEAELHHRKYTPTPQPGGNMMNFMIIFMLVISISWPAAMTIYWTISSIVTILKTLIVDKLSAKHKTL